MTRIRTGVQILPRPRSNSQQTTQTSKHAQARLQRPPFLALKTPRASWHEASPRIADGSFLSVVARPHAGARRRQTIKIELYFATWLPCRRVGTRAVDGGGSGCWCWCCSPSAKICSSRRCCCRWWGLLCCCCCSCAAECSVLLLLLLVSLCNGRDGMGHKRK